MIISLNFILSCKPGTTIYRSNNNCVNYHGNLNKYWYSPLQQFISFPMGLGSIVCHRAIAVTWQARDCFLYHVTRADPVTWQNSTCGVTSTAGILPNVPGNSYIYPRTSFLFSDLLLCVTLVLFSFTVDVAHFGGYHVHSVSQNLVLNSLNVVFWCTTLRVIYTVIVSAAL